MGYLLGIDLGTSGVKAILIRPEGDIVGLASKEYPILSPHPGWAEQDPTTWWEATCEVIRQVIWKSEVRPQDIKAVGLSGQMHGLVLLDRAGIPVRPAIIWPDKRSGEECDEITGRIDKNKLYEITGIPIATGFLGVSLLWVKNHEPSNYDRAYRALLPKDYVRYRLTGELATDVTDGSGTMLFDIRKRSWSEEIISCLDLRKDLLPTALESFETAGWVSKVASEESGIPAGTPVAAGGGDQAMGAVGSGTVKEGVVASTLGTGGQLITPVQQAVLDPYHRIHTLCHAAKDLWLLMGAILAAGLSLRWFKENLGKAEDLVGSLCGVDPYELLSMEAEKAEPGSGGLIFLPYLCGERTPHMNPKARGCLIGLNLSHTRAHIIRAIMEGVTFGMRDSLSIFRELQVPVKTVICSGGGARSRVWRQIQADVYGVPVMTITHDEHSSYGAALTAGVAAGVYRDILEACEGRVSWAEVVYPTENNLSVYENHYSIYRSLYPTLKKTFDRLG